MGRPLLGMPRASGDDSDSSEDCGCGPRGNFDFYDPEIMKQGGNGITLRRPRVIGSPIICMRTGDSCISRMFLDWSLLRSRSP